MFRRFLPVGQGAFYCEEFFCGVNIVYDCGSENKSNVIAAIDNRICLLPPPKHIEAVFISHLHYDHISGLEHLLETSNVRKIYFPQMTESEKIISLLDLLVNERDTGSDFIQNLHIDFNGTIKDISQETESVPIPKSEGEPGSVIELKGFTQNIIEAAEDWVFVPFNIKSDASVDVLSIINNALKEKNEAKITTPEDLCKCYKNPEVKKIITDVYKNHIEKKHYNEFSMTLYSGPNEVCDKYEYHCFKRRKCCNCECCYCHSHDNLFKVGSIYTGDYDAYRYGKNLQAYYKNYWDNIGTMQIPHHGSMANIDYSSGITKGIFNLIFSYGDKNKYKHPSSGLLTQILHDREPHCLSLVDENMRNEAIFKIMP
ncbi:MBL fold metallo-hydrolase [Cloacibacillus evryensis]|mgnify:CR=1 FL=1|uniref:MBL fold metallo-hydrolase n=1 Tax=Cloacibacillus evryensis TaxID=508460 RepID=UPI00210BF8AF|nr:MBL fold metallo-hydrolase [Cloacibacillus evryensis]MCQ4765467.1 MBL fold metallo-hydrolase [Cloacibacillus evryensis]